MMNRTHFLGPILLGFGLLATPSAAADSYEPAVALQCRGGDIAIRFGGRFNDDPVGFFDLPAERAATWADTPLNSDGGCTLANGSRINLRGGVEIARGYGMGGGDPPAFFSLWINGRKALSRIEYKAGYGASGSGPYANSMFLSGEEVARCDYPSGQEPRSDAEPGKVKCLSSRIDLAALQVDDMEPSAADRDQIGLYTVAARYNPAFCRRFVRDRSSLYEGQWVTATDRQTVLLPDSMERPFDAPWVRIQSAGGSPSVSAARLDFWSTGQVATIVMLTGETTQFYGDMLFYRNADASEDDIRSFADNASRQYDPEGLVQLAEKHNWWPLLKHDHINNMYRVVRLNGRTYVMEALSNTSEAALYRAEPETHGLLEVCRFLPVEPNF